MTFLSSYEPLGGCGGEGALGCCGREGAVGRRGDEGAPGSCGREGPPLLIGGLLGGHGPPTMMLLLPRA